MDQAWLNALVKLYETNLRLAKNIVTGSKKEKLIKYINVLEKARLTVRDSTNPQLKELLYQYYYDLYIIKKSNISNQYNFHNEDYLEYQEDIISNQKKSLDKWLDYLIYDENADLFTAYQRFWILDGVSRLGRFDSEKNKYFKRDDTTVYPFIELDKDLIHQVIRLMNDYFEKKEVLAELKAALGQANFKQIYEYVLKKSLDDKKSTNGIWVKYDQYSDYSILRDSLQKYPTGWCTAAGVSFAMKQIANGDFYVYYSIDKNNEYKIPRLAIKMHNQNRISEIRGISAKQNVEQEMLSVLENKISSMANNEEFMLKIHDMKYLTLLENKQRYNMDFNAEDLRFLYETERKIQSFGYEEDPRIKEIINKRNIKDDCSRIYNINSKYIAITEQELNQETIIYYGDLRSKELKANYPKLQVILGDANFPNLTDAEGLKGLTRINGEANFHRLKKSNGLQNLKYIGKTAYFPQLQDDNSLINLSIIEIDAYFSALTKSLGLNNLRYIGKFAYFPNLTNAEGLKSLEYIGSSAIFPLLSDSKGLNNLKVIGGAADFSALLSADDLFNLNIVNYNVIFTSLKSPKGLENLRTVNGLNFDINNFLKNQEEERLLLERH